MMFSGFSAEKEEEKSTMAPGPGLDTVADLERKLALLRAAETTTTTTTTNSINSSSAAPAFALPAAEMKKPSGESKDGKSALLARIMAAQERAKQAQQPPDLLSDTPPAFDPSALPPLDQPPVFDDALLPAPVQQAPPVFSWDPHAPEPLAPPPASAPDLNDLLAFEAPLPSHDYQSNNNNSSSNTESNEDVIAAILAMEGMSEADKQALIDEQIKIMASIEKTRTNTRASAAHSAADAFESRSFSNNVQSVNNPSRRMHMTTFSNASTAEEAAQLKADMELAEALQKEEYEQAERQQQSRPRARPTAAPAPAPQESQSWLEWLGVTSSATPTATRNDAPPPYAAPGQGALANSRGSYDEDEALLRDRPRARVAQSQPLFACVTDSVSTALTYAVSPPPEGVDSTSLLAMPQVGRNNEYERQE